MARFSYKADGNGSENVILRGTLLGKVGQAVIGSRMRWMGLPESKGYAMALLGDSRREVAEKLAKRAGMEI